MASAAAGAGVDSRLINTETTGGGAQYSTLDLVAVE
jgi:hypothetical protein